MAATIVESLLSGVLNPDDVVKWLRYELDNLCPSVDETCRVEFLPSFLNFLRDQFSPSQLKTQLSCSPKKNDRTPVKLPRTLEGNDFLQSDKALRPLLKDLSEPPFSSNDKHNLNVNFSVSQSNDFGDSVSPARLINTQTPSSHSSSKQAPGVWDKKGEQFKKKSSNDSRQTSWDRRCDHRNVEATTAVPVPDIQDLEAFPPVDTWKSKVRRITPTPLGTSFPKSNQNSTIFNNKPHSGSSSKNKIIFSSTPIKEGKDDRLSDARAWLREHQTARNNIRLNSPEKPSPFNMDVQQMTNSAVKEPVAEIYVQPSIESVTDSEKLCALASVYSACLHNTLVPNITTEMYFLVQLLTIKIKDVKKSEKALGNVHNCVYFAVKVLERQTFTLTLLDNSALNMIVGVTYLSEFSQDLQNRLRQLQNPLDHKSTWKISHIQGVAFQESLDNRQNFTSDQSFGVFKRQRDMFCDLFRDWQKNHLTDGWTMQDLFMKRVQNIVRLSMDPINYVHLARLIVSQLIQTCCDCEELSIQGGVDEDSLTELKQLFPEKFNKLKERLLAPALHGDPSPTPSFQGPQAFFHDFLQTSDSALLYQHTIDHLTVKITEINQTDVFDSDIKVDQEHFFVTVHTLRLLGKFLGLLVFLPYQGKVSLQNQANMELKHLRSCKTFPIDFDAIIQEAYLKRRLILTIPWVVEYLSMADKISLSMTYHQSIVNRMISIYHQCSQNISSSGSKLLLKLLLGWLFELPNFPQTSFFNFRLQQLDYLPQTIGGLDEAGLVNQKLINSCCPYVHEINGLLKNFLFGSKTNAKDVRKITPIAAEDPQKLSSHVVYIQDKLEENFFHYQPASMKRTVDFVADRVASKAIKNINRCLIPDLKAKELEKIKCSHESELKSASRSVERLSGLIEASAVCLYHSVLDESEHFFVEYGKTLVNEIVELLLPEDCLNVVRDTCCGISFRTASNKVQLWVQSNVTVDYFIAYLKEEVTNLNKTYDEEVRPVHDQSDKSYRDIIAKLCQLVELMHCQQNVTKEDVNSGLALVSNIGSKDSNDLIFKNMGFLYSDFMTMIIIHCPQHADEKTMDRLIAALEQFPDCSGVNRLLCPRNLLVLSKVRNPEQSWCKVQELIRRMIRNEVMTMNQFLRNCVKLIENSRYPQETLKHLYNCITKVLGDCSESYEESVVEDIKSAFKTLKIV